MSSGKATISLGSKRVLECKNLYDYLRTLPTVLLDRLYQHPATCLAVFRELPPVAAHFVLRILFVEQAVPVAVVNSWVIAPHGKLASTACETLYALRLWNQTPVPGGLPGCELTPTFRKNLKTALLGGGQPWSFMPPSEVDKYKRDVSFLDAYALERWELILHFMVGSETAESISNDTKLVLLHAGLLTNEGASTSYTITQLGFQFLLMDTSSQVWFFILQYLDTIQNRGMDLVECLSFLFQLSFLTLGQDYSSEGMSESLQAFLQTLRGFGLIYQRKRSAARFYPTRLALGIASGMPRGTVDVHRPGFIVVETNYRLYAYTDSTLQIALLGLFCDLLYRFPNLVVGVLTRESVFQALRSGITAEQIITYLHIHAHAEAKKMPPAIPPTVTDQIKLWELERDRFTFTECAVYNQFLSQQDFETLRNYARDLGVLLHDVPAKRIMIVSPEGHEKVRQFWKRQKQR